MSLGLQTPSFALKKNLTAPIPNSKGAYIISCGHSDKIAENPNQRHSDND